MRSRVGFLTLLGVFLFVVLGFSAAQTGTHPLAASLPSDALVHVTFDPEVFARGWDDLGLVRYLREPEVRTFLAPVQGLLSRALEKPIQRLRAAGLSPARLRQLLDTRVTFSVLGENGSPPGLLLTLDLGESSAERTRLVTALLESLFGKPTALQVADSSGHGWGAADGNDVAFATVVHEGRFLVATSPSILAKLVERRSSEDKSLAKSPEYGTILTRIGGSHAGVTAFVNVKETLARYGKFLFGRALPLLDGFGLGALEGVGFGLSLDGNRIRERLFLHLPKARGIWNMWPHPKEHVSVDRFLPENTTVLLGDHIDLSRLLGTSLGFLGAFAPSTGTRISTLLSSWEEIAGVDVRRDILPYLGTEVAIFAAPAPRALIPDFGVVIKLRNTEGLEERLVKLTTARGFQRRPVDFRGVQLNVLEEPSDHPLPCRITWAIVEERLVVTAWPQALKNLITGLAEKTPRLKDRQGYESLVTRLGGAQGLRRGVVYLDLPWILETASDVGVPFLQTLVPTQDSPFDLALFPSTELIGRHLSPLVGVSSWTEDGMLFDLASPMGVLPEVILAGAAAILIPNLTASRESARRALARSTVRNLKACVALWQASNGRLPTNEEWPECLFETDPPLLSRRAFPKGLIDPWGHPYRYQPGRGGSFQISSPGAGITETGWSN